MWPNPQKTADLVTFTEEVLNGKLHFLCGGEVNSNIFKKIIAALSSNETKPNNCDFYVFNFFSCSLIKFPDNRINKKVPPLKELNNLCIMRRANKVRKQQMIIKVCYCRPI